MYMYHFRGDFCTGINIRSGHNIIYLRIVPSTKAKASGRGPRYLNVLGLPFH